MVLVQKWNWIHFNLFCGFALFFHKTLFTEYDINERNSKRRSNSVLCDGLLLPKIRFHCKSMDEIADDVCFAGFILEKLETTSIRLLI